MRFRFLCAGICLVVVSACGGGASNDPEPEATLDITSAASLKEFVELRAAEHDADKVNRISFNVGQNEAEIKFVGPGGNNVKMAFLGSGEETFPATVEQMVSDGVPLDNIPYETLASLASGPIATCANSYLELLGTLTDTAFVTAGCTGTAGTTATDTDDLDQQFVGDQPVEPIDDIFDPAQLQRAIDETALMAGPKVVYLSIRSDQNLGDEHTIAVETRGPALAGRPATCLARVSRVQTGFADLDAACPGADLNEQFAWIDLAELDAKAIVDAAETVLPELGAESMAEVEAVTLEEGTGLRKLVEVWVGQDSALAELP